MISRLKQMNELEPAESIYGPSSFETGEPAWIAPNNPSSLLSAAAELISLGEIDEAHKLLEAKQ